MQWLLNVTGNTEKEKKITKINIKKNRKSFKFKFENILDYRKFYLIFYKILIQSILRFRFLNARSWKF